MRPGKPSLTAFLVADLIVALSRHPRWKGIVADQEMISLSRLFATCSRRYGGIFTLFQFLPSAWKVGAFEWLYIGLAQHYVLRKQHIEKTVLPLLKQEITQVINVGAGFDTLLLRHAPKHPDKIFFELDHPATQRAKLDAIEQGGIPAPDNLYFRSCDLTQESLEESLKCLSVYDPGKPALFILEGITMYLTEEENRRLLESIRNVSPQSYILFGVMEKKRDDSTGNRFVNSFLSLKGETYKWSAGEEELKMFLQQIGYRIMGQAHYAELQAPFRNPRELQQMQRKAGEHWYLAKAA